MTKNVKHLKEILACARMTVKVKKTRITEKMDSSGDKPPSEWRGAYFGEKSIPQVIGTSEPVVVGKEIGRSAKNRPPKKA